MPQSIEAEQAVLGGLMLAGNDGYARIAGLVEEGDFFRRDHRLIFQAIREMAEAQPPKPFDAVTLGDWFSANGLSEEVAHGSYLVELASTTPSAANIVAYAEIVADKAKLRKLIEVGAAAVDAGYDPEGRDSHDLVAELQRSVAQLAGNPRVGGMKGMREIGSRWYEELRRRYYEPGQSSGLLTPWGDFNKKTGGFRPGELIIFAGRPSMGKSAAAINVMLANALRGKRCLFFNLEMTDLSIYNRCIGALQSIPLSWLREPDDSADYWSEVTAGVAMMNRANLEIDDTPELRQDQIVARARREHMKQPVDLVVIDHMHIMPLPGKTKESTEVGHITRAFKGLAKSLNCPVIALSQLNRSLESRANKRPVMADLRESGNIEQDADMIVFLYRDDYYAEHEGRPSEYPGMVEIIIGKQREGEVGKVWTKSALGFGRIDDYDGPAPERAVVEKPAKAAVTSRLRGVPRDDF